MKRFFIYTLICSLTALMGCDKNDEVMNDLATTNGKKVTVTANIQGDAATRVTLTQNDADPTKPFVKVDWKASGETFEAYADGAAEPIIFTQIDGTNRFEGTLNGTAPYTLYYGAKDYDLSTQDGTLNEAYVLMQATATDFSTTIDFEHKTAILKPTFIKVDDAVLANNTITQIVVEGIKKPSAETESGSITVMPESPLGDIYIFLPAFESYTADHTFTFIVTAGGQDYLATLTIPNGKSIEAGKFYTAAITIAAIPYLTFTAQEAQTFTMNEYDYSLPKTLQYSVGGSAWTQLNAGDEISFDEDHPLRLRGNSPTGTAQDDGHLSYIVFGDNSTPVACTGDIRTLVDWKDYENANTNNARFSGLFMKCRALTTAPALPATTLADNCYAGMFLGCTSLATAPALPATTLANYCYSYMFQNCTSLTAAPVLPATTLKNYCYYQMFRGCTSLATAPALPATTLASRCYFQMFYGCTSLATAPVLPATTLASWCYYEMFRDCTSLNSITMLATDISASDCLYEWVSGVATTGTFYKNSDATWDNDGVVPSGWTVQNYSVTP